MKVPNLDKVKDKLSLYQKLFLCRFFHKFGISTDLISGERYSACIGKNGEIWVDETQQQEYFKSLMANKEYFPDENAIPPNKNNAIYFDWYSTLTPNPPYAHPSNPIDCKINSTYFQADGNERNKMNASKCLTNNSYPIMDDIKLYKTPIDSMGYPLNPYSFGTSMSGVKGRGLLALWGPNHAGDAIITRKSEKNKIQVVLIQRNDGSEKYAFPGGFVDPNEYGIPLKTILREFLEESVGYDNYNTTLSTLCDVFGEFIWSSNSIILKNGINYMKCGNLVYKGIVEDERNTDNAWIETVAIHWHLNDTQGKQLRLKAGDDAKPGSASFYDIEDDPTLMKLGVKPRENLFASHSKILNLMIKNSFPDEFI